MLKHHTPRTIHPPFARYSHGVELPEGARLLVCSGQLGIDQAGHVPADTGGQAALCFANIVAILTDAGLAPRHVVRINAYVVDRTDLAPYMAARDAFIAGIDPPPASTLMIVAGFARPEFRVEVEALAAAF